MSESSFRIVVLLVLGFLCGTLTESASHLKDIAHALKQHTSQNADRNVYLEVIAGGVSGKDLP